MEPHLLVLQFGLEHDAFDSFRVCELPMDFQKAGNHMRFLGLFRAKTRFLLLSMLY
jgi:hypothetical protein